MGLELADWLVLRGVKKLFMVSRRGITSGYQAMRINLWKTYGVTTTISTADLSKTEEVHKLLRNAEKTGPVIGIFNLAGVRTVAFGIRIDLTSY